METKVKTKAAPKQASAPKPENAQPVRKGSDMKGLYGWLKGKVHYESDAIFNLGRE